MESQAQTIGKLEKWRSQPNKDTSAFRAMQEKDYVPKRDKVRAEIRADDAVMLLKKKCHPDGRLPSDNAERRTKLRSELLRQIRISERTLLKQQKLHRS